MRQLGSRWGANGNTPALYPQKRDPIPITLETVWDLGSIWTDFKKRKSLTPPGFDPQTVQSVANPNPLRYPSVVTMTGMASNFFGGQHI